MEINTIQMFLSSSGSLSLLPLRFSSQLVISLMYGMWKEPFPSK